MTIAVMKAETAGLFLRTNQMVSLDVVLFDQRVAVLPGAVP